MNGSSSRQKRMSRLSRALCLLSITALALAASPTAFAHDRGGPGAPSAQQPSNPFCLVLRKLPKRFASWSD